MFAWLAPGAAFAGAGGGGAPGGNDCANRPHDCPDVDFAGKTICLNIGTDSFYYVYDDPAEPDNPKLVRYIVGQAREVIANYVEDFQVSFGEDINGDGTISSGEWVNTPTGPQLTNPPVNIRLAKVNIIVKTEDIDPRATSAVPPTLENSTIAELGTADQKRRRVMSRTIRLRNAGN